MENSFSNENIQLSVQKLTGCTLEYSVTCLPSLLKKAEKEAIKKISKDVSLPGFRKGKVPEDVIRKNYRKALEAEMRESVTQLAFQEARKLETSPIMHTEGAVGAKVVSFSENEASFIYTITITPEAPSLDKLDSLKIEAKPLKEVTEADLQKEIKNLLRLFATWNDITDRSVQEGDFVRVDGFDLSTEAEEKILDNTRLDVSKEGLATTWLYEALLGMELNGQKVVETFPNAEEPEEFKKNFEAKKIRLELKKIEQPILPELDEAFVQKLGLPSVEELQKKMRERMENEALQNHLQLLKDRLTDQVLKEIELEVPTLLVDRELASRMRRYLSNAQGKKEFESLSKEGQEQKKEEIRRKSADAIRLYFIIQAIIRKFQIQPPSHINQTLTQIAQKHIKEGGTKRASQEMVQQAQNEQNQFLAEAMMDTALIYVLDKVLHLLPQPATVQ